jgi:hypothetical protein
MQRLLHFVGVNPQTGIYAFQDIDNNGSLTYPNDYIFNKEISQKYFGGFANSITYKHFQLDFMFQFVKQTGYNYLRMFNMPGAFGANANQPNFVLNHWQKIGELKDIQQYSQDCNGSKYTAYSNLRNSSDDAISDASFIRLKNIALSYNLASLFHNKIKPQSARIYLQCQNVLTITQYLGLDPETQSLLPPLRVLTAGIQITL